MRVIFKPQKTDLPHLFLLGRIRRVWSVHSSDIVSVLQASSGLRFQSGWKIIVGFSDTELWEGTTGYSKRRAITLLFPRKETLNYDNLVIWLIIHELGHRLLEQNGVQSMYDKHVKEEEWHENEHKLLFLFLIDALKLLGPRGEKILQDYPAAHYTAPHSGHTKAWRWANNLTPDQRKEILKAFIRTKDMLLLH